MATDDTHLLERVKADNASPKQHAPRPNVNDFRNELSDLHIPDEQVQEFLQILWDIMAIMVDLGMRVDICEQISREFNIRTEDALDGVKSDRE